MAVVAVVVVAAAPRAKLIGGDEMVATLEPEPAKMTMVCGKACLTVGKGVFVGIWVGTGGDIVGEAKVEATAGFGTVGGLVTAAVGICVGPLVMPICETSVGVAVVPGAGGGGGGATPTEKTPTFVGWGVGTEDGMLMNPIPPWSPRNSINRWLRILVQALFTLQPIGRASPDAETLLTCSFQCYHCVSSPFSLFCTDFHLFLGVNIFWLVSSTRQFQLSL